MMAFQGIFFSTFFFRLPNDFVFKIMNRYYLYIQRKKTKLGVFPVSPSVLQHLDVLDFTESRELRSPLASQPPVMAQAFLMCLPPAL